MKRLVVFYSLEGNTKFIAENIARAVDADLLELKVKKSLDKNSFMKFLWGGKQVFMREKPALFPLEKNPNDYDLIFIGTPVWAFTYSAPLNTFFHEAGVKNKKIALFICHGGGIRNTFGDLRKSLSGNEIIGEADFFEPLKKDAKASAEKAKHWALKIVMGVK